MFSTCLYTVKGIVMNTGTIIYAGGFELPDKNAAAHRVTANGKIFSSLGYRVVYLGTVSGGVHFDGIRQSSYSADTFEEEHPEGTAQWIAQTVDLRNLKAVADKYSDVRMVIVYNVPYLYFRLAKAFFSKRGIKVVYDCTEWSTYSVGNALKRTIKRADEYLIENRLGKKADGLIVISEMMRKKYASHPRLLVLPPLVDISDPVWNQSVSRGDGIFEFCFAGSVGGAKESIDAILGAFSGIAAEKTRLRIVGITKDEFINKYPDKKELTENSAVVFMGRVPHDEAVKTVLSCDCYIFIRVSDKRNNAGFPTKFVEATTCGVPLITTGVSDIRGFVSDNSIILDNADEKGIAGAMLAMINGSDSKKRPLCGTFHYAGYIGRCRDWLESFE